LSTLVDHTKDKLLNIRKMAEEMAKTVSTSATEADDAANLLTESAERASEMVKTATEDLPVTMWKAVILTAVLACPAAVSSFCVWQHFFSAQRQAAENWVVFEEQIMPRLTRSQQDTIIGLFKSSSAR